MYKYIRHHHQHTWRLVAKKELLLLPSSSSSSGLSHLLIFHFNTLSKEYVNHVSMISFKNHRRLILSSQ